VSDEETSRAILKKYVNRRVEVEGTISRIGTFWDSQARCNVPSVCLTNPEIRDADHPVVSNHVWVAYAQLMTNAGVEKGDTVRCSVQVYAYQQRDAADPNKTFTRYGFREPRDLKCLNRDLSQGNGRVAITAAAATDVEDETEAAEEVPPMPEPVKAVEADARQGHVPEVGNQVGDRGGPAGGQGGRHRTTSAEGLGIVPDRTTGCNQTGPSVH